MKYIFILLIISNTVYGQSVLKIEYDISGLSTPKDTLGFHYENPLKKLRMLVNDSMAVTHYYGNNRDPFQKIFGKRKSFGNKIIGHGFYQDFITQKNYTMADLQNMPKYLVNRDVCDTIYHWQIFPEDKKYILGYNCIAAVFVNKNNDSTLIWFTNDLKFKQGSLFYGKVPGIILEAYQQSGSITGGSKIIVNSIEEMQLKLIPPSQLAIISCEAFNKILKERQGKNKVNISVN